MLNGKKNKLKSLQSQSNIPRFTNHTFKNILVLRFNNFKFTSKLGKWMLEKKLEFYQTNDYTCYSAEMKNIEDVTERTAPVN